jgi:peptidoglycan hydrolase FlgJ
MTSGADIIAGVARAADPAKQREAVSRLKQLRGEAAGQVQAGEQAAGAVSDWATNVRRSIADASQGARIVSAPRAADGSKDKDVYVQFEALLLQNMIETMMPDDAEAVFGSGTAGSVWKSMLAEKVAAQIARSGALGIAQQIAAGPTAASATTTPASTQAPPETSPKVDDV